MSINARANFPPLNSSFSHYSFSSRVRLSNVDSTAVQILNHAFRKAVVYCGASELSAFGSAISLIQSVVED